ncbi:MAG: tetratricopeptide repeat protein [Alphaproteobacteria bacterium]|nr:tetratricopeptide repeat protein [Alphaproteobacteria bacterium]
MNDADNSPENLFRRALDLHRAGDAAAALSVYDRILAIAPGNFDAVHLGGVALSQLGKTEAAIARLQLAVSLSPSNANAYNNLAIALREARRNVEAAENYARAIALAPADPDPHFNLGNLHRDEGRPAEALACYDAAIARDPRNGAALVNRANLRAGTGNLAGALADIERALALAPANVEAATSRGTILQRLGRIDEAIAAFRSVIALAPGYGDAHLNLALCLLLRGEYAEGWREFEWRWRARQMEGWQRRFDCPAWTGREPVAGRRVLVFAEQGFGDTLQFARYARVLAARGARVVLEVQPPLAGLMRSLADVAGVVATGTPVADVAFHCALMSLPFLFGPPHDYAATAGGYLHAGKADVERWAARLGPRTGPRVGVAWSGRAGYAGDFSRAVPLAEFGTLFAPGVEFVSIQKDVRDIDRAALDGFPALRHFGAELRDFADTAALCALMDHIVTVDSATAHLAGALGRPTSVLLHRHADWRWLESGDTSLWYPSAELLRQAAAGDWSVPLAQARTTIGKLAAV